MAGSQPGPGAQLLAAPGGGLAAVDPVTDLEAFSLPAGSPGAAMLAGPRAAWLHPRRAAVTAPVIPLPAPPGRPGRLVRLPGGRMGMTPSGLAAPAPAAAHMAVVPSGPVITVDPPLGSQVIQSMPDGSLVVLPLPPGYQGADDGAVINTALLEAGGAAGTGGLVRLGPYAYNIKSTISVPGQSIGGGGAGPVSLAGIPGATILNVTAGTGIYCHRTASWGGGGPQNSNPNPMTIGSFITGLIIDGTNAPNGAVGLDAGDFWGLHVLDVVIRNFVDSTGSAASSIGFWRINRVFWTEKSIFRIHTINCDNHIVVDRLPAAQISCEYNDWDLYMYCLGGANTPSGAGQNGMTWQNGVFQGGGRLFMHGNHGGGGAGAPGTLITVTGSDGGGNYSALYNVEYDIIVEGNGSSNKPVFLLLGGANNVFKGHGQVAPQYAGWSPSVLNGGLFAVAGRVSNDAVLTAPGAFVLPATNVQGTYNGVDAMLYLSGGTMSAVFINGVSMPVLTGPFLVRDGTTIKVVYTAAPAVTLVGAGI